MNIDVIVDFLQDKIGISPDSVGPHTIKKAIQSLVIANDVEDLALYYQLITTDSDALQQLIDTVVIPETSFFRDKKPFQALKENVHYFKETFCKDGEPLKILSVPSSTGEEPYSIAMTCLEAGLDYGDFEIHACDISTRALEVAKRGVYSEYSFRGCGYQYKSQFFSKKNGNYVINEKLRDSVTFFHGNIIGDGFVSSIGQRFHIVFCRNLLIYFDRPTKKKALDVITLLLHDDGVLVVGHADTAILPSLGYKNFSEQFSFAYVKGHSQHNPTHTLSPTFTEKGKKIVEALIAARQGKVGDGSKPGVSPVPKVKSKSEQIGSVDDSYQLIRNLVTEKKYQQAQELAEVYIDENGGDGRIFHCIGQIAFEQEDFERSELYFKKAVYLMPDDETSLNYLASIERLRGNSTSAQRYEQRAARIIARKSR